MTTAHITAAWIEEALARDPASAETVTISGTTWETVLKLAAKALREERPENAPRLLLPDIGTPGKRFDG